MDSRDHHNQREFELFPSVVLETLGPVMERGDTMQEEMDVTPEWKHAVPAGSLVNFMTLPNEVIMEIVKCCTTPFTDPVGLGHDSCSALKALSCVNRRLRAICLSTRLHRVKRFVFEESLANRIEEMKKHPEFLANARYVLDRHWHNIFLVH